MTEYDGLNRIANRLITIQLIIRQELEDVSPLPADHPAIKVLQSLATAVENALDVTDDEIRKTY